MCFESRDRDGRTERRASGVGLPDGELGFAIRLGQGRSALGDELGAHLLLDFVQRHDARGRVLGDAADGELVGTDLDGLGVVLAFE